MFFIVQFLLQILVSLGTNLGQERGENVIGAKFKIAPFENNGGNVLT